MAFLWTETPAVWLVHVPGIKVRYNQGKSTASPAKDNVLLTIASDIFMYKGEHILIVAIFKHMHYFCVAQK